MLDVAFLNKFVEKNYQTPSPHGASCKFIKFDDNWGIKTYYDCEIRDSAYNRQKKASEAGLAPTVGSCFDVGYSIFCYITELAVPLVDCTPEVNERWSIIFDKFEEENPNVRGDINNLCEELNKVLNRPYYDAHFGNFGMLRDKLVCIDFS